MTCQDPSLRSQLLWTTRACSECLARPHPAKQVRSRPLHCRAEQQGKATATQNKSEPIQAGSKKANEESPGLGLKAIWYGAEQFGNIFASFAGQKQQKSVPRERQELSKLSRKEVLNYIKEDYNANYFVNGAGDMSAYEEDCLFTDPFSGFRGTQRFKKNVGNFGNFLEDVTLDIMEFKEVENGLRTRWRFGATLKFPWRPRLAAAGRTTHFFSKASNRVVEHREEWDTQVSKVLQQLLKPGKQKRTK